MDYGKAFTYPQQDPDWLKKFLIAGALYFVPVVGQLFVAGYGLEITRRVIENNPQVLPEWTDFGMLIKKGLYALVVGLVYALPVILLSVCAQIPNIALSLDTSGSNTEVLATVSMVVAGCLSCLIFIYAIFMGMVMPAALARVAATDQLGAAFKFGEVIGLVRSKPAVYFIVMLVSSLALSLLASVGLILCFVGIVFGAAYGVFVSSHLNGQAYLAPAN
jgi:hypothetical protein